MFGYDVFKTWFDGLSEEKKIEVLGDIFEIKNVSVYSFSKREDRIVVQLYAEGVFYQFIFIFDDEMSNGARVEVQISPRFVIKRIYVGKDFLKDKKETVKTFENLFDVSDLDKNGQD